MYKKDTIAYFGKAIHVAEALMITKGAVSLWPHIIPEKQALRLERLTNGKLKYNSALYHNNRLNAK